MTSVYGITYIGARDQIKRRLKERNCIADGEEVFAASRFAAKVALNSSFFSLILLQEVFKNTLSQDGPPSSFTLQAIQDAIKPQGPGGGAHMMDGLAGFHCLQFYEKPLQRHTVLVLDENQSLENAL